MKQQATKVEIVANQAVEENIVDRLSHLGHGEAFTYFHPVFGRGNRGRREGSAVWPETNTYFIILCKPEEAQEIIDAIAEIKARHPREGIRCWAHTAEYTIL